MCLVCQNLSIYQFLVNICKAHGVQIPLQKTLQMLPVWFLKQLCSSWPWWCSIQTQLAFLHAINLSHYIRPQLLSDLSKTKLQGPVSMSVHLFVCLSVCLSACITQNQTADFTEFFMHVFCDHGSLLLLIALPVLWMTSCFNTMGPVGHNQAWRYI